MQRKTWEEEGVQRAIDLLTKNLIDLKEILRWNIRHDVSFYRCSSHLVPWATHWDLELAPDHVHNLFSEVGTIIQENDIRFSFHPAHFATLASPSDDSRNNAIAYVNAHGEWMDRMGLPRTPYYPINIHVGGHYGDKEETAQRWISTFMDLEPGTRQRLTLENDDSPNAWSVTDLVDMIHPHTGVSVTFDYHHHQFNDDGLSYRDAFDLAETTWDCRPVTHYSEPRRLHEEDDPKPQNHSRLISSVPKWMRDQSDVMVEATGKERALPIKD
jgi:UV DNA damage endonuclease